MTKLVDGPASSLFSPLRLKGNAAFTELGRKRRYSQALRDGLEFAHHGKCVAWGVPFDIGRPVVIHDAPVQIAVQPCKARWLVFLHTSDVRTDRTGEPASLHGEGRLGEHAADYVLVYEDGEEVRTPIRRRHQVGILTSRWGENCTEAVSAIKPRSIDERIAPGGVNDVHASPWGEGQKRVAIHDRKLWVNFLWALENPRPRKTLTVLRFEPVTGTLIVFGVSAGNVHSEPLRWARRRKAILTLPSRTSFDYELDTRGGLEQIQLDLGQVISARALLQYPQRNWASTRQNLQPTRSMREVVVEYAAHPEAAFHVAGSKRIPVSRVSKKGVSRAWSLQAIAPSEQRVKIRVLSGESGQPVPVKLHVHGAAGEYLAPVDRHRIANPSWFEDYSADLVHGDHQCVYIPGETVIDLPLGRVYIEITKGFEMRPVRRMVKVTRATETLTFDLEKVLHWRERGWVSADTHVHFLSPQTAALEGAAEDVNLINLLASQWGELMTNVGDFDGKTTFGSHEAGGDGEHLVRVGTENRQHVLGHISLIGYEGNIIAPMCTDGPDESAIGTPVSVLITEWARQCHAQGGVVVVPHFPDPRLEHAASIVLGEADGIEMCSQEDFYSGIDPYSLSDWYRYLNNGYLVPAVGGTDKMSARWAVGTVRTYAKIAESEAFTLKTWMEALRRAETFVSYGPLLEFEVEGQPMGGRLSLPASGGSLDVTWKVESAVVPTTRVELIVNGEVRESRAVAPDRDEGHWSLKVDRSSWAALLVRAKYPDKAEMIAAHSTPVMVDVHGSAFFAAADALTILAQIEGSMAYIDTIATRAEAARYRAMRLVLESAYRRVHDHMHAAGFDHPHTQVTDHPAHHAG